MKKAQCTWDIHQEHETISFWMDVGGNNGEQFYILPQGPMFTGETMSEWPELGKTYCK